MLTISRSTRRLASALICAAAVAACSSGGTDNNLIGSIALTLASNSGSAQQGGQLTVGATLTRGGGYTGTVDLTVTGNPAGVTASVGSVQTSGTTTTAIITVSVGAATAPGSYAIVVHGNGSGVPETTANYQLTVTAAATPAYALSLNPAGAINLALGVSPPVITVNLDRTNFTGPITLAVEGLPAGVTGTFGQSPTTGNSTTLTLSNNISATLGTINLTVRGTATGLADRTAPLSVTITQPASSVVLSLSNANLSIVQGASAPTTTVNINRSNFPGNLTLSVDNLPTGVTASFNPANPQTLTSSVLTLTVAAGAPVGTFNNLLVRGTGAGIADATTPLTLTITAATPSSISLSLSSANLSAAQGSNAPNTTITINRNAFPGNVTLSVDNLPTGVTAAFNPVNPQQSNSSVLTLTVAAGAPIGTFNNLAVRGAGAGITDATTPLTLTITAGVPAGSYTLTTTPSASAFVTQGNSLPVTINIVRAGGNQSAITFTTTPTILPNGMTLGINPNNTTANTTTLTITTTGATPAGATPIVIKGTTTGLADQTVNLTINVNPVSGGGNATADFSQCTQTDQPVWLAFMDGTAGTWTAVTGTNGVFHFNITQSKGSVAWVTQPGGSSIFVQNLTQAEMTGGAFQYCAPATVAGPQVTGNVTSMSFGFSARVSWGGSGATVVTNGPFQIVNTLAGTHDLVGYMRGITLGASDRVFVKRSETPVAGALPTTVDFLHGTLSASSAIGSATLTGLVGGETVSHSMIFYTNGGACEAATLYFGAPTAASFNMYGVPASLRTGNDMHSLSMSIANGLTSFRLLTETFVDPVTRAGSPFVAPAQYPVPTVTDAGGPYKRPQSVVNGFATELNLVHQLAFTDQTDPTKNGFISASQGWIGGQNVTLVLPNFVGVGGFQQAWMPATGDQLNWTVSGSGGNFTSQCAAAQRFVTAARTGTL